MISLRISFTRYPNIPQNTQVMLVSCTHFFSHSYYKKKLAISRTSYACVFILRTLEGEDADAALNTKLIKLILQIEYPLYHLNLTENVGPNPEALSTNT